MRHSKINSVFLVLGFFLVILGFLLTKQTLYCLSHICSPFCSGKLGDEVLGAICPGWLRTVILLISVSQVASIVGVTHGGPVLFLI
jgi:hypothetical protein